MGAHISNGGLGTTVPPWRRPCKVHRLYELLQQLPLMLKTKKLLRSNKHSDCTHNASFAVEKHLVFGKVALFDFC